MPRLPIDYFKTVMYKFVCKDLSIIECYAGSTTSFRRRKNGHKSKHKNNGLRLYQFINSNGGWDNWEMIEIEKYPCMDSNEKRARERYWIETLGATLNMRKPITTENEIKEYQKVYQKEYQEENGEKLKAYQFKYRQEHKNK
jgi:hypothetical protein